jgi:hypothetical protein|tara:strand:- start:641 stop:1102 length:462 start_codon:yes stop_codon:yes gene_type:complete
MSQQKRIALPEEIRGLTGKPFLLPIFDEEEAPEVELEELKNAAGETVQYRQRNVLEHTTNLLDVLIWFITYGIPAKQYKRRDTTAVPSVYAAIQEARKRGNGVLELHPEDHKWLQERLEAEDIGVRVFTMSNQTITDAITNFVKETPQDEEKE